MGPRPGLDAVEKNFAPAGIRILGVQLVDRSTLAWLSEVILFIILLLVLILLFVKV
jgi:hypothetical protein